MNYEKVPNIITGKDLDYLSDMFNWNYCGYKSIYSIKENINDNNFIDTLDKCLNSFNKNMLDIISIINKGETNE